MRWPCGRRTKYRAPMAEAIKADDVRVGHVAAVDAQGEWEPCTLLFEQDGVFARVPVFNYQNPGRPSENWHHAREVPSSLLYADDRGVVVMHDSHWRGTRGGMAGSVLDFDAEVAIFGAPNTWPITPDVEEMSSRFDLLEYFKHFPRVSHERVKDQRGLHTTLEIRPAENVTWKHGDFEYFLDGEAPSGGVIGRTFSVESETWLRTKHQSGATAQDHLSAQWPIRALVTLSQGHGLYWREHKIGDPAFDDDRFGRMPKELRLAATTREAHQPVHVRNAQPLFNFDDLGEDGMRRWLDLLQDVTFRRAVDPAAESLTDQPRFSEVRIMLGAMALDAMGQFRHADGKRHGMHENLEPCLDKSGIDWSALGGNADIASAISALNNDVKHADRSRPDGLVMVLVARLLRTLFRAQLFDVLSVSEALSQRFASSYPTRSVVEAFDQNRVGIVGSGKHARFERLP